MSMIDLIAQAAPATRSVASNVQASQLSGATPCTDFDVKTLANHIAGFYGMTAMAARKQPIEGDPNADLVGNDPASVIPGLIDGAVAAWKEPGALEGTRQFGPGEYDGEMAATITLFETVFHGWDLAKATGQELAVGDEVAEAALGIAQMLCNDDSRASGVFGPEVSVPADAPALDRALGLAGRDPNWSA